MKKEKFYSYRYFVIHGSQTTFVKAESPIIRLIKLCKQQHLEKNLISKRVFGMVYIREITTDVHLLKFYKSSTITKYEFDIHDDISAVKDITLPFVYVVIDTNNQIILMSKNTSVFQKERLGRQALQEFIEAFFNDNNIVFSLDPIVDNQQFWLLINDAKQIFKLSLNLKSPNLFNGYNSTNEFLKAVENATNTDSVSFTLENKNGNLNISPDQFRDPLSYADGGGGDWKIDLICSKKARRIQVSSGDKIRIFSIRKPLESSDLFDESDKEILEAINSAENVLPKPHE